VDVATRTGSGHTLNHLPTFAGALTLLPRTLADEYAVHCTCVSAAACRGFSAGFMEAGCSLVGTCILWQVGRFALTSGGDRTHWHPSDPYRRSLGSLGFWDDNDKGKYR